MQTIGLTFHEVEAICARLGLSDDDAFAFWTHAIDLKTPDDLNIAAGLTVRVIPAFKAVTVTMTERGRHFIEEGRAIKRAERGG